jgi:hypothetical protein
MLVGARDQLRIDSHVRSQGLRVSDRRVAAGGGGHATELRAFAANPWLPIGRCPAAAGCGLGDEGGCYLHESDHTEVLVADDDKHVVMAVGSALRTLRTGFRCAGNGREALAVIRESRPCADGPIS